MSKQKAYVFSALGDETQVLCGEMELTDGAGYFSYHRDWLALKEAYPLDPINLPLINKRFRCDNRNRVFGGFSDAGPDAWGTRIMLMRNNSQPKNEVERLLRTSGNGVGALQFSLSRTRPKTPEELPTLNDLVELDRAIASIGQGVSSDLLKLVEHGSSMGGARPKVALDNGGHGMIAKFRRADDVVDNPLVEYATMSLCARAGLNVPTVNRQHVAGHCVFLIDRFDRSQEGKRHHFISAHALFNQDKQRTYREGKVDPAGYIAFARVIRRVSDEPEQDLKELFRRAATNVMLGNTDDHARNHGLLYNTRQAVWRLSPMYDVMPIPTGVMEQAMSLGEGGRARSIDNVLSMAPAFGLNEERALGEVRAMHEIYSGWEKHFKQTGLSEADINILSAVVTPGLDDAQKVLTSRQH